MVDAFFTFLTFLAFVLIVGVIRSFLKIWMGLSSSTATVWSIIIAFVIVFAVGTVLAKLKR